MNQQGEINKAVANCLRQARPNALPAMLLLRQLRRVFESGLVDVDPDEISINDVEDALTTLHQKGWADFTRNPLDPSTKIWRITDLGEMEML